MTLSVLNSVGPYKVLAQVGAGAMGEVYKAHDTRLDRMVALKILPESFARDAERLRRFEQEARTLASRVDSRRPRWHCRPRTSSYHS